MNPGKVRVDEKSFLDMINYHLINLFVFLFNSFTFSLLLN